MPAGLRITRVHFHLPEIIHRTRHSARRFNPCQQPQDIMTSQTLLLSRGRSLTIALLALMAIPAASAQTANPPGPAAPPAGDDQVVTLSPFTVDASQEGL